MTKATVTPIATHAAGALLMVALGSTACAVGVDPDPGATAASEAGALQVDTACTAPPRLAKEAACAQPIVPERSLLITDLGVVEDATRTAWSSGTTAPDDRSGVWHFGRIMTEVFAGNIHPEAPAKRVERFLREHWIEQVPAARHAALEAKLLDPAVWPRRPNGDLNLQKAPFRLLAIATRIDLRDPDQFPGQASDNFNYAGELRFVYALLDAAGHATPLTVILEFAMPLESQVGSLGVGKWARDVATLSAYAPGSCAFNMKLEQITRRVTRVNAMQGFQFLRGEPIPNNSPLLRVRSNERISASQHDFRQWYQGEAPSPDDFGNLVMAINSQTPGDAFNGTQELANLMNKSEAVQWDIVFNADNSSRKLATRGSGNLTTNAQTFWNAPGIQCLNPSALGFPGDVGGCASELRHHFSLNTCTGCHGREVGLKAAAQSFHVRPREAGTVSVVSSFFTGKVVADPVTGKNRSFGEYARRTADLKVAIECAP